MNFVDELKKQTSLTRTENGAIAYKSTCGGALLDLFSVAGALRSRPEDVDMKFHAAWAQNRDLATLLAFYTRDARGGLGERNVGRRMLRKIGELSPATIAANLGSIVEFGRWDDLLVFLDSDDNQLKNSVLNYIKVQLLKDIDGCGAGKPISLLAKWLPSENASSANTIRQARVIRKYLGITSKMYRKTLTKLRAYLEVVEATISANKWGDVKYSAVPSNAMNRYTDAFKKHDFARFDKYLDNVAAGKEKINASVLFPYNIIEKFHVCENYIDAHANVDVKALDAQWKALPNYVEGENNYLVMADFSGSMNGRPMDTSLGLAIYFAERNKGVFANKFMSFTNEPHLCEVRGDTIKDKIVSAVNGNSIGYNTNLEAAFNVILNTAVRTNCAQEDLPKALIIISDMEIDQFGRHRNNFSFYSEMKHRFAKKGYEIPAAIFWNVNSRKDTFLASADEVGVQFVSGQSASTFKTLMGSLGKTAEELMIATLTAERYSHVILPSKILDF